MSQSTVVTSPRVARRIIRNYLRITLVHHTEPEALTSTALERAEAQLNRVPGYKLVKAAAPKAKVSKAKARREVDDTILADFFPKGK